MSETMKFRKAVPGDEGLILTFIRELADYEGMLDQVVADEATLHTWIFEKEKADAGLLLPSFCIDTLAEECRAFRNTGDDCYLYDAFESRLEDLHLSEKEQCSVLEQHRQAMEESVFPAGPPLIFIPRAWGPNL